MNTINLPTQDVCHELLLKKYAAPGETTRDEIQHRVSSALSNDNEQRVRFLQAMKNGFLLGGRVNSAAGTNRRSTMINCFVQPVGDGMSGYDHKGVPSITTAVAQACETMRLGGGVGYDFSDIRPEGAIVKGTGSDASGPISFMRMFDRACDTVKSAGDRRGAQMAVIRVDHPDVQKFINSKKAPDFKTMGLKEDEAKQLQQMIDGNMDFAWNFRQKTATLSNFNISVGVTNEFMEAVIQDLDFDLLHEAAPASVKKTKTITVNELINNEVMEVQKTVYVYETVKARDIWNQMMLNTYTGAEPGVLFLDNINTLNNLRYCEVIKATNPCGEQVLPSYGCCCLGSINLSKFVADPFGKSPTFDFANFRTTVFYAVEMLDNVLDKTNWPLEQQGKEAANKRRVGLGFTALANAMAMMGIRYDSEQGADFAKEIAIALRDNAYEASVELAVERGSFPFLDVNKYLEDGTFASSLPEALKAKIRKHGIRNSHLLSIAPTGTISMAFGDNASSGIEPTFALKQDRFVMQSDGSRKLIQLHDYAYRVFREIHGEDETLPDVFATALNISVADHLRIMAAVAPFVDSAISKTVNIPEEYSFEDFKKVYMDAWQMGLKGITTYRPNTTTGSVIVSADEPKKSQPKPENDIKKDDPNRRVELKEINHITDVLKWPSRPNVDVEGVTYHVEHPEGNFAVVVNHWQNGRQHPFEVYVAGNEQPRGLAAIAKALSIDMRTDDGAWLSMKLDSLLSTKGDDGFDMQDRRTGNIVYMPSLAAGFANIVKYRLEQLGSFNEEHTNSKMVDALFSKKEPKTGPMGALGWHVDVMNHITGDDFLLHTKELVLPNGQVRPYSVWLSGQYPKVLDGLMKTLSIDMRISDQTWIAMKLKKLTTFGEVRGDFMAQVPGESKQQTYPSTVAYIATLLLARYRALGLLVDEDVKSSQEVSKKTTGHQCPACHAMTLRKSNGCDVCDNCGHTGSCG